MRRIMTEQKTISRLEPKDKPTKAQMRLYMPLILKSIKILLRQVKCSECPK